MTAPHSKIADPRYIPGISEFDDDMTDSEWWEEHGEPTKPLLETRTVKVVYYPEGGSFHEGSVTVEAVDVSEEAQGRLTEYLIVERGMDHEWEYEAEATGEGWQ